MLARVGAAVVVVLVVLGGWAVPALCTVLLYARVCTTRAMQACSTEPSVLLVVLVAVTDRLRAIPLLAPCAFLSLLFFDR